MRYSLLISLSFLRCPLTYLTNVGGTSFDYWGITFSSNLCCE